MAKWSVNSTHNITWNFVDVLSDVKIELSRDSGDTYETLTSATSNDGVFPWKVTEPTTSAALVKVSGLVYTDPDDSTQTIDFTDITDTSDNVFEIVISSNDFLNINNWFGFFT
jgi:hypothetical protein